MNKMSAHKVIAIIVSAQLIVISALTPSTYITKDDSARFQGIFTETSPDLASAYYSWIGLSALGVKPSQAWTQNACKLVKDADTKSPENIFFASSVGKLSNCQIPTGGSQQLLDGKLSDASVVDIYYIVNSIKNLGLKLDGSKVSSALTAALKKDDSVSGLGWAFHIAMQLPPTLQDPIFDRVEDAVVQADEVDGVYLQFEGGVSVTAAVVDGIFALAEARGKAPVGLKEAQVTKLTNYLLSRKHVQAVKSAGNLLQALRRLDSNKFQVPVTVSLASAVAVDSKRPLVQVRVATVFGQPLPGGASVVVDSAKRASDSATVLSKKPLSPSKQDPAVYEMDLATQQTTPGFYKLALSVTPAKKDIKFVGLTGASVDVKVVGQVVCDSADITIGDKDQSTQGKTVNVKFMARHGAVLEADAQDRVVVKFSLLDRAARKPVKAHQTFVTLSNLATQQEVAFVAELDKDGAYKFEMDVGGNMKEFGAVSGKYALNLIVGDAIIANPFAWNLATININFGGKSADGAGVASGRATQSSLYSKKPEIKHMFRQPEKRPPMVVSKAFTVAVIAVPFLVLLALWARLGVNISNFPFSISSLVFHIGLAGVFGLYYCFWTYLNMFDTLWYLAVIGSVTFLAGQKMLSAKAEKRAE